MSGLASGAAGVSGRLIVCPTPIGNLEDVTLRVLAAPSESDLVSLREFELRHGVHEGALTKALRNSTPRLATASMFGVRTTSFGPGRPSIAA